MSTDPATLVEALWLRFRPLVDDRVRVIEEVAAGGGDRAAAARAAHNLAGSLGSYGRTEASAVAREIDDALARGPVEAAWLREAVRRLREAIDRQG